MKTHQEIALGSNQTKLRQAFSLIELLVVIAIIMVLASLLLPGINSALSSARQVGCVSNERQLHMGFSSFIKDNNEQKSLINADDAWSGFLMPYVLDEEVFFCPDDIKPDNKSNLSNYYIDIIQQDYNMVFTEGPWTKVFQASELPVNESGDHYYRVYKDRKLNNDSDPNNYVDHVVADGDYVIAMEDTQYAGSDLDFNDLVIVFSEIYGGGYEADVIGKYAGWTFDLYKEGQGLITPTIGTNVEFTVEVSKITSYGVNMLLTDVHGDSDKILLIDYPNQRVLSGFGGGSTDDWFTADWDVDNNGTPDFARHRYHVNTLMGDGSVKVFSVYDIDPMNTFNAETYWDPK